MLVGEKIINSKRLVNQSIQHATPYQVPVDFLAVPQIWEQLFSAFHIEKKQFDVRTAFFDPNWETVNGVLNNDCRLLSYDQFVAPARLNDLDQKCVDWFSTPARSSPNRMFRIVTGENNMRDIWGRNFLLNRENGSMTENVGLPPLRSASSKQDIYQFTWPDPDWWDFSKVPEIVSSIDPSHLLHWRYRAGSIFEVAWQLCGFEKFLLDLSLAPEIPMRLMGIITDIMVELLERFLEQAPDDIDMIYFYDDLASQQNLLISMEMWRKYVKPHHQRLIDVAKSHRKTVMYHCDGNIHQLIPEFIDMGIDVLNPIQPDISDMQPSILKKEFGDRLCFHGGIDICMLRQIKSLSQLDAYIIQRKKEMLKNGGYILAPTHHIQANTPIENIIEMYQIDLRRI